MPQLTEPQRQQLDGIVAKMHANGETDDSIQAVVNDFKQRRAAQAPSMMGGMAAGAAVGAVPMMLGAAEQVATNPGVPAMAASAGRVVGGIAPIVAGAQLGGPVGALAGVAAAAKGAWAGGKTGWFTGKLAQELAAPIANALQRVAPYAQVASKVTTPLAIYDLAQRLGPSNDRKDNPALLNDIAAVIMQHLGASPETVATVKAGRSESK